MNTKLGTASTTLEQHPLAQQYCPGSMSADEFDALCGDLKKRGQQVDIITFEGKVLDGWSRYRGLLRNGQTPRYKNYDGDDPSGMVIALNVLRRRIGHMQRAIAGARLNIDFGITQDEASKCVGIGKAHVNLVAQALRSGNSRIVKMLENPDLTREMLHDEMIDAELITGHRHAPKQVSQLSTAGAHLGLDALYGNRHSGGSDDADDADETDADTDESDADTDDIFAGSESREGDDLGLDGILGDPPTPSEFEPAANTGGGKVGIKPTHPERRPKPTVAQEFAERFRGLGEADQISFMQLAWPIMRKLLSPAGLTVDVPNKAKAAAEATQAVIDAVKGKSKGTPNKAKASRAGAAAAE